MGKISPRPCRFSGLEAIVAVVIVAVIVVVIRVDCC